MINEKMITGNNTYVAWSDNTPGNADILLRKSDNAGVTFGSPINVSRNAGFSELPAISVYYCHENTTVIRNKGSYSIILSAIDLL